MAGVCAGKPQEIKLSHILANHLDHDPAMKPVCNLD